ncbi:MAG: DUF3107 domain-containing protein [Micropruina sp.]|nr:DUF3107 domain-containing protein [Micropruina sp.]
MEVKVGIKDIAREITLETELTAATVTAALTAALTAEGLLTLTDSRGRTVLIPAQNIAYLDLGEENVRRVGFGTV